MSRRRSSDRLYTATLMAFGAALVGLGLLGVPALLVAAIGIGVATLTIALVHRLRATRSAARHHRMSKRSPIPARYVPSVLEGSSMRRRRTLHLRRRNHSNPPLRFR
ncbi:MAG TPA: hypothetical protein VN522_08980 [Solirubrobacterales bacterium]|nr:hypothetical protein [Solirubrobacterales bacterium]